MSAFGLAHYFGIGDLPPGMSIWADEMSRERMLATCTARQVVRLPFRARCAGDYQAGARGMGVASGDLMVRNHLGFGDLAGLRVTVAAGTPDTIDDMVDCLTRAAAEPLAVRAASGIAIAAAGRDAVVIFVDEFPEVDVVRALTEVRDDPQHGVVVLVSNRPDAAVWVRASGPWKEPPTLLRGVIWGWSLLETIRLRCGESRGGGAAR